MVQELGIIAERVNDVSWKLPHPTDPGKLKFEGKLFQTERFRNIYQILIVKTRKAYLTGRTLLFHTSLMSSLPIPPRNIVLLMVPFE